MVVDGLSTLKAIKENVNNSKKDYYIKIYEINNNYILQFLKNIDRLWQFFILVMITALGTFITKASNMVFLNYHVYFIIILGIILLVFVISSSLIGYYFGIVLFDALNIDIEKKLDVRDVGRAYAAIIGLYGSNIDTISKKASLFVGAKGFCHYYITDVYKISVAFSLVVGVVIVLMFYPIFYEYSWFSFPLGFIGYYYLMKKVSRFQYSFVYRQARSIIDEIREIQGMNKVELESR